MTTPVADIKITASEYRIRATVHGHAVAQALRSSFGWHLALHSGPKGLRWTSRDTTQAAVDALFAVASRRLLPPKTAPSPLPRGSEAVPPQMPAVPPVAAADGGDGPQAVPPAARGWLGTASPEAVPLGGVT